MDGSSGASRVWTDEQLASAARLHAKGLGVQAVADKLGLSRSTTRRLLVRAGRLESMTEETADVRREELQRLLRHLITGASLTDAARAEGWDVQHARTLIRSVAVLIPEGLPVRLERLAERVRAHLHRDDVRSAAAAVGIDPWFALLLLQATGSPSMPMQPQRREEERHRAASMAARRATGASFETIAAEFGIGRERVRRILLATGGWTPRKTSKS